MKLKPNEVYISEEQLDHPDTIFRYPDLIIDGVTYRQIRALPKQGGVVCIVLKGAK